MRNVLMGLFLVCASVVATSSPAQAADKPPALLEPYAGYDIVFGPTGPQVLGPDAGPAIDAMLHKPVATLDGAATGCTIGDIRLEPQRLLVEVTCADGPATLVLQQRTQGQGQGQGQSQGQGQAQAKPGDIATVHFAVQRAAAWATPCDKACEDRRLAVTAQLADRVRRGEGAIAWQRVRPEPGSAADTFLAALVDAHQALAIQDLPAARTALRKAKVARAAGDLQARQWFDLAVLAREGGEAEVATWAVAGLQSALAAAPKPAGATEDSDQAREARAYAVTVAALQGDPTGTASQADTCLHPPGCDLLPAVRALAAVRAFAAAAALLDKGPLLDDKPRQDLLKLRFGLASALNDAPAEQAVGRRMVQLHPDAPEGYDVLASGLARAGEYRQAIETLHDLSKQHPERDIILGRIAGMLNFLTAAAGQDPKYKADLDAVELRMKMAAVNQQDIVARFIVATRAYYAGRLQDALPQLQALLDSGNRDPRIPLYTAMANFWLGNQEVAQKLIQHAVEIGPSDPDVFYCRSQIIRKVNLPLAIADLERYETMTTQPWSIGPKLKSDRVKAELAFMRKGLLPPDWDKPGPERAVFLPDQQTGTQVSEDVRLGRIWVPGAPTPTDAQAATANTPVDGAQSPTRVEDLPPPVNGPKPPDAGTPLWPLLLLTALGAAVLARYLGGRVQPSPSRDVT